MKALIFDMDGLMIDTERLYFEAERDIAIEYGKTASDELLCRLMARSPEDGMKLFKDELKINADIDELIDKRIKIMTYKYNNDLVPMKGLFEILNFFHNKMKLAIATGSPKIFLDIVVDKLRIRNFFDVLQTSDEIKNGKPHPEIYIKTARKLNFPCRQCIVLEDSRNGALSAKNAGCYTIAVKSEYTKNQDLSFADNVFNNLLDAKDAINLLL